MSALLALGAAVALAGTSAAPADEPLDLVPAESLLCWSGCPFPDTSPPAPEEQPSPLATLLDVGTRIAGRPLNPRAQLTIRLLEAFGLLIRFPHALALIDASAKPVGADLQGRQLDELRLALIVQTGGRADAFRRVIQKVVNEQTDDRLATLRRKAAWGRDYQELRDRRLPDWCRIAWGQIGQHFVLTVGREVWPLIAAVAAGRQRGLSRDPWVAAARRRAQPRPLIEIYLAARAARQRLDPLVDGRASGFLRAWQAEQIDRAHWALGFQGRALYCLAHLRAGEQTIARLYADPQFRGQRLLATIPPGARYAVYHIRVDRFVVRFVQSLLAVRSAAARQSLRRVWQRVQTRYRFDARRDLLAHLGQYVVMHNDPPHPLHIPLAMTMLVEIRSAPRRVRATLETICRAWQTGLQRAAEQDPVPNPAALRRDEDGVWYLRFGPLAGPAWTVTDRFIISSWSPAALRSYLAKVGPTVGRPNP